MLRHIDFVEVGWIPNFAGFNHVIDGGKNHPSDGNNGTFFALPFANAFVFGFVVRRFIGLHRGMGDLHQRRSEVYLGT